MRGSVSFLVALVAALFSVVARLKPRQAVGFTCLLLICLSLVGLTATPAFATGYGQQAVVVQQQYAVAPQVQQVVVPQYAVVQQQNACNVQAFSNGYSQAFVSQPQFFRSNSVQFSNFGRQRNVQRSNFGRQNFSSFQRSNSRGGGGRQRSFSVQSSSSGGGFFSNILPF